VRQTEILKLKRSLEARQAELVEALRKRDGLAIETTGDELELVRYSAERELALSHLSRESRLLREIRSALGRFDDGSFGTCVQCGRQIPLPRLKAVPWASCCLPCQETAERAEVEEAA
jgi:DnaK suppressor protein